MFNRIITYLIKRKTLKMTVSVCEMDHMQIEVAVDDGRKEAETEYCKHLTAEFTPCVGQQFFEIDEAVTFYKIYALASWFDVRKYSTKKWRDGEIKSKLLVCNREGFTYVPKGETVIKKNETGIREEEMQWGLRTAKQRKYTVKRVGCKAHVRLFMKNGVLVIDRFHMGHNHELVSSEDRQFQKMSWNIEDFHKYLIMYNSRVSLLLIKPPLIE
ncbi:uncharacterized protein LOC141638160 isoform X2 [Silene latifolia]|uniref:uncharacterized protein LOC141638160 isoform X2 n=1 Tax=Silene latifolia TaxID=37657 RepID=UPI003D7728D6